MIKVPASGKFSLADKIRGRELNSRVFYPEGDFIKKMMSGQPKYHVLTIPRCVILVVVFDFSSFYFSSLAD